MFANWVSTKCRIYRWKDSCRVIIEYVRVAKLEEDIIRVEGEEVVEVKDDFVMSFKHLDKSNEEGIEENVEDSITTIIGMIKMI